MRMPVNESALPAVLRERARLAPTATAFTFVDYGEDSASRGANPHVVAGLSAARRTWRGNCSNAGRRAAGR